MAIVKKMLVGCVVGGLAGRVGAQVGLSPSQDINLGDGAALGEGVVRPLEWVGANAPYFAGPDVNNISNAVPAGCTVDQVAYVVRHGSRYPDAGAYAQWVALHAKIQNATFTAGGELAFLGVWEPVLTDPELQIAMESPTGFKEAFDLGYVLRTRYGFFFVVCFRSVKGSEPFSCEEMVMGRRAQEGWVMWEQD